MQSLKTLYKTNPIRALIAYLGFIQVYAYDIKLTQYEAFQIDDLKLATANPEVLWLRTRRGGKSKDASVWIVFMTIVGLNMVWFAVAKDQKKEAKKWFQMNPFVADAFADEIILADNKDIPFLELTRYKSASRGADGAVYDETGKIDIEHEKYEFYDLSRGILAESRDVHILNCTTPSLASVEKETYDFLLEINPDLVSIHPWQHCHWLNKAYIERERKRHPEDPWHVLQEYECQHVTRGGALLTNIIDVDNDYPIPPPEKYGVDIGKTFQFVGITISDNYEECWVCAEHDLDIYQIDDEGIMDNIFHNIPTEIEDGGFNYHPSKTLSIKHVNVSKQLWDRDTKSERLGIARSFKRIYINKKITPKTYNDLTNSIYHKLYPIWLKDAKHPVHWLESFMHALGAQAFHVYPTQVKTRMYQGDRIRELMRRRRY